MFDTCHGVCYRQFLFYERPVSLEKGRIGWPGAKVELELMDVGLRRV